MRSCSSMVCMACVLMALSFVTSWARGATNVSGAIATSTWTEAGSPFHVTGDLTVPANATLSIEAGVVISIDPGFTIIVRGTFEAAGPEAKGSNCLLPTPPRSGAACCSSGPRRLRPRETIARLLDDGLRAGVSNRNTARAPRPSRRGPISSRGEQLAPRSRPCSGCSPRPTWPQQGDLARRRAHPRSCPEA